MKANLYNKYISNQPISLLSQPIDPEDIAVVTVGASKEVVFKGGPQPWIVDQSKYFQKGIYLFT